MKTNCLLKTHSQIAEDVVYVLRVGRNINNSYFIRPIQSVKSKFLSVKRILILIGLLIFALIGQGTALAATNEVDVRDYASFSAAIDNIGGSAMSLLIPNQQNVTANKTVPSNVTLRFIKGGLLNISSGVTVTINGYVDAGLYNIFSESGAVSFGAGSVKEVYPEWWGALPDNSTDSGDAIRTTIATYNIVKLQKGTYRIASGNITQIDRNGISIIGAGATNTKLRFEATSGIDALIDVSTAFAGLLLKGFTVEGPGKNTGNITGILEHASTAGYNVTLEDICVEDLSGDGIHVNKWFNTRYINCRALHVKGTGIYINGDQAPTVIGSGSWSQDIDGAAWWFGAGSPFIQGLNCAYVGIGVKFGREASDPGGAGYCYPIIFGLNIEPLNNGGTGIYLSTGSNISLGTQIQIYSDDGVTQTTAAYGIRWKNMSNAGMLINDPAFISFIGSFTNYYYCDSYLPYASLTILSKGGADISNRMNATGLKVTNSIINHSGTVTNTLPLVTPGLTVTGSVYVDRTTKAEDYTVTYTSKDLIVEEDCSGATRRVALDPASWHTGRILIIKKTDGGNNYLIVNTYGTQTIDGVDNWSSNAPYAYITIYSNGSNWLKIGGS